MTLSPENPLVSVLITTFNHEKYIGRCIDAILNQKVDFPIEILILDDASSDATSEILISYANRFPEMISLFIQKTNLYLNNQKGFPIIKKSARGAYIAYCDGDDYWTDPEKLSKQVKFLESNPEYVLSFHNTVEIDIAGDVISEAFAPHDNKFEYSKEELRVRQSNWIFLGTLLFRNVPIDFPPEYHLIPNGDNFIPMLLSNFGGGKFQGDIGPLAYQQHDGGDWSGKTEAEKDRMHLQSYLQIAAYYVRVNNLEVAQKVATMHLINKLFKTLQLKF